MKGKSKKLSVSTISQWHSVPAIYSSVRITKDDMYNVHM